MVLDDSSLEMILFYQLSLVMVTLLLTRSVKCAELAIFIKVLICIYKHKLSSRRTIDWQEKCTTDWMMPIFHKRDRFGRMRDDWFNIRQILHADAVDSLGKPITWIPIGDDTSFFILDIGCITSFKGTLSPKSTLF